MQVQEKAQVRQREQQTFTKWLRNGQVGGSKAIAKELNRSITYVEARLAHFNTTRGIRKWVGPQQPSALRDTSRSQMGAAGEVSAAPAGDSGRLVAGMETMAASRRSSAPSKLASSVKAAA